MVERNVRKLFLSELRSLGFDVLVLDLIDERFAVLEIERRVFVTISDEFLQFKESRQLIDCGRVLSPASDEHFFLWTRGATRLLESLFRYGMVHKLNINKAYWAERFEDGSPLSEVHPAELLENANAALEAKYRWREARLYPQQFLRFDREMLSAARNHRLGVGPFHFRKEYYTEAEKRILEFASVRLDPRSELFLSQEASIAGNSNHESAQGRF